MNAKKLISSATVMLVVSSAFAQQENIVAKTQTLNKKCPNVPVFEQGYELTKDKYPAAYNAPARIEVQNSWDVFLTGSFIYWFADQDGMDLAYSQVPLSTSSVPPVVRQNSEFKPGFKFALGLNYGLDNWVGYAEYTWFHQSTHNYTVSGIYNLLNWLNGSTTTVTNFSSRWTLNMDLVDLMMTRPFYQSKNITVAPIGGIRGAWIRQSLRVPVSINSFNAVSHNKSKSWAVGPRGGCQGHWLLGMGFRAEGDAAASLLFTRFVKVTHRDDYSGDSDRYSNYDTVRPMFDMSLGLGWGSYINRQDYHVDLSATYDFIVMYGQNMMMPLVSNLSTFAKTNTPADLHMQGLTVTFRFDF